MSSLDDFMLYADHALCLFVCTPRRSSDIAQLLAVSITNVVAGVAAGGAFQLNVTASAIKVAVLNPTLASDQSSYDGTALVHSRATLSFPDRLVTAKVTHLDIKINSAKNAL